VDRVAIGQCPIQSLEQQDTGAVTAARSLCIAIERATMAVRRTDAALLIEVAARTEFRDARCTGERHLALAPCQAATGLMYGNQRS